MAREEKQAVIKGKINLFSKKEYKSRVNKKYRQAEYDIQDCYEWYCSSIRETPPIQRNLYRIC